MSFRPKLSTARQHDEWLNCLAIASVTSAMRAMGRDPTTTDPVALADRFYEELRARCEK